MTNPRYKIEIDGFTVAESDSVSAAEIGVVFPPPAEYVALEFIRHWEPDGAVIAEELELTVEPFTPHEKGDSTG